MNIDWFELLIQIATILVAFFGGGAALVPVVNWLKNILKLNGTLALLLTAVISFVMGTAVLFVEGQIAPDSFTIANLSTLVIIVFGASQKFYEQLKGA